MGTGIFTSLLAGLFPARRSSTRKTTFSVADPDLIFNGKLSEEADRFLTESNTEFNEKQNQLREQYLSDQVRYDIDFEKGTLVIVRPQSRVTFEMKLLGSCRNRDNSWEWAWNNPNIDRKIAFPRSELAPLASKHQLHYLDAGAVVLPDEKFPWHLGGIALKVSPSASGIYSASSAGMRYFLVLYHPIEQPLQ